MSDRAKYMCVAHNKYGSINYTYELDVVGKFTIRYFAMVWFHTTLHFELKCFYYH